LEHGGDSIQREARGLERRKWEGIFH
jgi:hypothetical protein